MNVLLWQNNTLNFLNGEKENNLIIFYVINQWDLKCII